MRDEEKKKLAFNGESNPKRFVFAIWRFIIELQKIMKSFCTCLTCGDGAAPTLTYIRKTQGKRIFTPRKFMMLGISERYCGMNCYCSEGVYARNQNGFLHETLHQKLSLPWLVVSCKCKIRTGKASNVSAVIGSYQRPLRRNWKAIKILNKQVLLPIILSDTKIIKSNWVA